jgi:hypothetical protein
MPRHPGLSQWHQTVSTYLSQLSQPQVTVLVLWSLGMVLAQSCGLSTVAIMLAYLLDVSERSVRERLRDCSRDAAHKRGARGGDKRRRLDVSSGFPALLRWVVAFSPPTCCQLALAMDASTLGQRFTILTISVVIRGCAIPVAWHIVPATPAGAWRPHGEALFEHLQERCAGRLDRHRGGRPRLLCQMAVSDTPEGRLASLAAHQPTGPVVPGGRHDLSAAPRGRHAGLSALGGPGHLFCDQEAATLLQLTRALGCGL